MEHCNNQGRGEAEWHWPAINSQGRIPGAITIAIALGLIVFTPFAFWTSYISWPLLSLGIGILAFFRDPKRVVPQGEGNIIAPADGLVTLITQVDPPQELVKTEGDSEPGLTPQKVTRISIFMSVFDVHINRAPIAGRVTRMAYIPGKFMNAGLDKAAQENERQHILLERTDGELLAFTQIAGLVARRIVPFVKVGDTVAPGQRIGLIRFGSRVDVYLPAGTSASVLPGQRTIAGETVLGIAGEQKMIEGVTL